MKRRTALLAMLGAIPGLGFLKRRKVAHPCCCNRCDACWEKWEIIAGEWRCEYEWTETVVDMQGFTGSFGPGEWRWEHEGTVTPESGIPPRVIEADEGQQNYASAQLDRLTWSRRVS
jgi:hypothetical protein